MLCMLKLLQWYLHPICVSQKQSVPSTMCFRTARRTSGEIHSRSLHGISISLQSCSTSSLNSKRSSVTWLSGPSCVAGSRASPGSPRTSMSPRNSPSARNPELPEARISHTQFFKDRIELLFIPCYQFLGSNRAQLCTRSSFAQLSSFILCDRK